MAFTYANPGTVDYAEVNRRLKRGEPVANAKSIIASAQIGRLGKQPKRQMVVSLSPQGWPITEDGVVHQGQTWGVGQVVFA